MHSIVLFGILGLAWGLRYIWSRMALDSWRARWHYTITLFLFPTLLLFTTAISIVWMGPHGRMVWMGNDWLSYCLAIGFLGMTGFSLLKQSWGAWQLLCRVRTYPIADLEGTSVRLLDLSIPCIAQIGFWQTELVISQGFIVALDLEHRAAAIAHEQAHDRYHDTFYFFWLGWVRQVTAWLPQTEVMWQELLVLREIRADRWASAQTDPLLVAEALLSIVQYTPVFPEHLCAAFSQMTATNRLDRRIEALLTTTEPIELPSIWSWAWLLFTLLPLFTIPFHI
jgi:Zn-dependent protease with chaperone function